MNTPRTKCALAGVIWLVVGQFGIAALPRPLTWQALSDDGQFILVMISPYSIKEEGDDPEEETRSRAIRSAYSQCGLYLNDGSGRLLWTCEYRSPCPVIIAPDGDHVIFPGDWTHDEYGIEPVTFMRCGQIIREYQATDLIPQYLLKCAFNGFSPVTCAGVRFDPDEMTFAIATNQGEEFVLDVTTGDITATRSPFPTLYPTALATTAVLISALVFKRRRQSWGR
jgi:hypothetical protein